MSHRRLVFDIETAPLPGAETFLEPVEAPSNYKDPVKIDAYIAEKTAEQVGRCGLDVDLCRIVALGMVANDEESVSTGCADNEGAEASLLRTFWDEVADGHHLVGFNCLGFDLPVLQRRSLYLGVPMPALQVDKYRHPQVTDLSHILSYNGALKLRSLSFYCKRFGIDVPDTMTGADIAQAVIEQRWHHVLDHVRADVQKTARLAERLGLFRMVAQSEIEVPA